jgi:hypothetical protein
MQLHLLDWNPYQYPEEMRNARQAELRTFWLTLIGPSSPIAHFDVTLQIGTLYHGDLSPFLPRGIQGTLSYCGGPVELLVVIVPTGSWVKHHWSGTLTLADLAILRSTYRNEGEDFMEVPLEEGSYPDRWICSCTVSGRLSDSHLSCISEGLDLLHTLTYTIVPRLEDLSADNVLQLSRPSWDIPSVRVLREVATRERQDVREPLFRLLHRAGDSAVHRPLRVRVDARKSGPERYSLSLASGSIRVTVHTDGETFWWEANANLKERLSQEALIFRLSRYQPTSGGLSERFGLSIGVSDWVRAEPTAARPEMDSLPPVQLGPVARRYLDWISTCYPAAITVEEIEERLARRLCRAEVVFYCFLRGQDLKLNNQERSCYLWLGDLIIEAFCKEKDWYNRVVGWYISASPPQSKQHQAYIEVLATIERAEFLV